MNTNTIFPPPAKWSPQNEQGTTKRLEVLKASLKKKHALFDAKLSEHFDTVKQANGQPLNDKLTGRSTLNKWERQNDALRKIDQSIGLTMRAIELEESKIAAANSVALPKPIQDLIEAGELTQWRRHPTIFFVEGVGKARIIWDSEKGIVAHRYLRDIPKDQYPKFRDVFNKLSADIAEQQAQGGEA